MTQHAPEPPFPPARPPLRLLGSCVVLFALAYGSLAVSAYFAVNYNGETLRRRYVELMAETYGLTGHIDRVENVDLSHRRLLGLRVQRPDRPGSVALDIARMEVEEQPDGGRIYRCRGVRIDLGDARWLSQVRWTTNPSKPVRLVEVEDGAAELYIALPGEGPEEPRTARLTLGAVTGSIDFRGAPEVTLDFKARTVNGTPVAEPVAVTGRLVRDPKARPEVLTLDLSPGPSPGVPLPAAVKSLPPALAPLLPGVVGGTVAGKVELRFTAGSNARPAAVLVSGLRVKAPAGSLAGSAWGIDWPTVSGEAVTLSAGLRSAPLPADAIDAAAATSAEPSADAPTLSAPSADPLSASASARIAGLGVAWSAAGVRGGLVIPLLTGRSPDGLRGAWTGTATVLPAERPGDAVREAVGLVSDPKAARPGAAEGGGVSLDWRMTGAGTRDWRIEFDGRFRAGPRLAGLHPRLAALRTGSGEFRARLSPGAAGRFGSLPAVEFDARTGALPLAEVLAVATDALPAGAAPEGLVFAEVSEGLWRPGSPPSASAALRVVLGSAAKPRGTVTAKAALSAAPKDGRPVFDGGAEIDAVDLSAFAGLLPGLAGTVSGKAGGVKVVGDLVTAGTATVSGRVDDLSAVCRRFGVEPPLDGSAEIAKLDVIAADGRISALTLEGTLRGLDVAQICKLAGYGRIDGKVDVKVERLAVADGAIKGMKIEVSEPPGYKGSRVVSREALADLLRAARIDLTIPRVGELRHDSLGARIIRDDKRYLVVGTVSGESTPVRIAAAGGFVKLPITLPEAVRSRDVADYEEWERAAWEKVRGIELRLPGVFPAAPGSSPAVADTAKPPAPGTVQGDKP